MFNVIIIIIIISSSSSILILIINIIIIIIIIEYYYVELVTKLVHKKSNIPSLDWPALTHPDSQF